MLAVTRMAPAKAPSPLHPHQCCQHPPVALVHLFPFSSMPAAEVYGKKYIESIKVGRLDVLRAQKVLTLHYFVCAI